MAGRLFDRFYTVESGRHATGLGLTIAKHLTEPWGDASGGLPGRAADHCPVLSGGTFEKGGRLLFHTLFL